MAKTRISVYLIKEGLTDHRDILKVDKCEDMQEVDGVGTLYSKMSCAKTPHWAETVFGDSIDTSHLTSATASAVFVVPVSVHDAERIFALAFGYGYSLIEKSAIEERFGLKTALNLADANSLRKVSRTTVAGNALKSNEQLPRRSSIGEFSLDIERDLLDGVTVSVDDDLFSGNINGSDSFSFSAEVNTGNVVDLLEMIYGTYCSEAYKASFEWVDRITCVRSPKIIEQLNAVALECVNSGSPDIWMAVPAVVEWEKVSGFRIAGDQNLHQDILIEKVIGAIPGELTEFSQLKRRRIKMLGIEDMQEVDSWSSDQCLFGEVSYRGSQYCLNGGKWYLIDKDFAKRINDSYDRATVSDVQFPECGGKMKESDYNKLLAESGAGSMALMDAKNISYGGGKSKVELCDVLTDTGCFIHVKHYSGSSVLSHLFNQGLVSAELMTEPEFRVMANKKLTESFPEFGMDLINGKVEEVIFGVITKDEAEKPNIPFFSKVTYDHVASRLRMMSVKVSIKAIHKR